MRHTKARTKHLAWPGVSSPPTCTGQVGDLPHNRTPLRYTLTAKLSLLFGEYARFGAAAIRTDLRTRNPSRSTRMPPPAHVSTPHWLLISSCINGCQMGGAVLRRSKAVQDQRHRYLRAYSITCVSTAKHRPLTVQKPPALLRRESLFQLDVAIVEGLPLVGVGRRLNELRGEGLIDRAVEHSEVGKADTHKITHKR